MLKQTEKRVGRRNINRCNRTERKGSERYKKQRNICAEGATVSNALDNGDGSFTISGNLDQPVSVELPEGYEGTSEVQFQGYDDLGSSIDGASGSVEVEIDDQYTMQGSTQEQQPDMAGMESGGSDWTSSGGQEQGVDFTDDSGSFDSDSQTGTDQGNDLDQSQI